MNLLGQYEHNILTSLKYSINHLLDYVVIVIVHKSLESIVLILSQHRRLIR